MTKEYYLPFRTRDLQIMDSAFHIPDMLTFNPSHQGSNHSALKGQWNASLELEECWNTS